MGASADETMVETVEDMYSDKVFEETCAATDLEMDDESKHTGTPLDTTDKPGSPEPKHESKTLVLIRIELEHFYMLLTALR